MTDQGAPDEPEQAEERAVFQPVDLTKPRDNLKREWVQMPEWGDKWVCVWGLSARQEGKVLIATGDPEANPIDRHEIGLKMRVCRSVYDSDKPDAKQLFNELTHGDWLMEQPDSAITRIVEVGRRLGGTQGLTTEELVSFFGILPEVVSCLTFTASASGACTACPKNSTPECLQKLSAGLLRLTAFFRSSSTGGSATGAPESTSASSSAPPAEAPAESPDESEAQTETP